MGGGFHRVGLRPGEQFMSGNEAFAQLQVLLAVVGDALGQLVGMRQKKVEVEGACLSQHLCRRIQGGSFLAIGSSLAPVSQGNAQLGGPAGLSHLFPPLGSLHIPEVPFGLACGCLWLGGHRACLRTP
jgi:hypothetical protein